MITINMQLLPCGQGIGRSDVLTGSIWTTDCGRFHAYHIQVGDGDDARLVMGSIPKTQSGHRNPFHLLSNIAQDIIDGV